MDIVRPFFAYKISKFMISHCHVEDVNNIFKYVLTICRKVRVIYHIIGKLMKLINPCVLVLFHSNRANE